MMSGLLVVLVLVGVTLLLLNLAVYGFLLWVVCKWCHVIGPAQTKATLSAIPEGNLATRLPGVSYRRCLLTVVEIVVLNVVVTAVLLRGFSIEQLFLWIAATLLLYWALALLCIRHTLKPPLGKTMLVSTLWIGVSAFYAVGFVFGMRGILTEALVIPTGGMAETLWGWHKIVACPQCGHEFAVNCTCEMDAQSGMPPVAVIGCVCPNCRFPIGFQRGRLSPLCENGDRVFVAKGALSRALTPARLDVVAFYYPERWFSKGERFIYLKRLVGLPGETIAVSGGKLYLLDGLAYEDARAPAQDLWRSQYMHADDEEALRHFHQGKFRIVRKSPAQILALRRLVFDNDRQAKDLAGKAAPRWSVTGPAEAWVPDNPDQPQRFHHEGRPGDDVAWLRYRHTLPAPDRSATRRQLITDFSGYNAWQMASGIHNPPAENWVGDLLLECTVNVEQAQGELLLELSKGADRFQARWDLASGQCTLFRAAGDREVRLETKETELRKPGRYRLRLADVDDRLTVWVDDSVPFGDGVLYDPPLQRGPVPENDLQPAGVGARGGAVTVSRLQLWRDTYYTANTRPGGPDAGVAVDLSQPEGWDALRDLPLRTFYVQPGHFLCLGDNSPESADSRYWGAVPEQLLLGKVFFVYSPFSRAGPMP